MSVRKADLTLDELLSLLELKKAQSKPMHESEGTEVFGGRTRLKSITSITAITTVTIYINAERSDVRRKYIVS